MEKSPLNTEIFLENNHVITKLHEFISNEAKESTHSPQTRTQEFLFYLVTLKKELEQLYKIKGAEDRKALCHFYLGELYAKCPQTYYSSKQRLLKISTISEQTRVKCALIHYINAMLETNRLSFQPNSYSIWQKAWWRQRSRIKTLESNKKNLFLQTILTLTELLNTEPTTSIALDSLYPKARLVLGRYIQHAQKIFIHPRHLSQTVRAMLNQYQETIFEKMGINIDKARLKVNNYTEREIN